MTDRDPTRALSPEALRELMAHHDPPSVDDDLAATQLYVPALRRGQRLLAPSSAEGATSARAPTQLASPVPAVARRRRKRNPRRAFMLVVWATSLLALALAWHWILPEGVTPAGEAQAESSISPAPRAAGRPLVPSEPDQADASKVATEPPPTDSEASPAADSKPVEPSSEALVRLQREAVHALAAGDLALAHDLYGRLAEANGEPVYHGITRVLAAQLDCDDGDEPCD